MKILKPLFSLALCATLSAGAQSVDFKVTLPSDSMYSKIRVLIQEVKPETGRQFTTLQPTATPGTLTAAVPASPYGIYRMYCTTDNSQYALPVYVDPSVTAADFGVKIGTHAPVTTLTDPSNRALDTFQQTLTDLAINLNTRMDSMTDDQVKAMLATLTVSADSIINALHPTPVVADFIRLWSYNSEYELIDQINFLARRKSRPLVIDPMSILPSPVATLDSPMASSFMTSLFVVTSSLPRGTLEERLQALYDTYQTPSIRKTVAENLAKSFVDNYNYGDATGNGEQLLASLTEKYDLPESLMTTFRSRSVVLTGKPFPDVKLVDRDGNPVDFGKFKGKWVYVDLWASWCGPCCKEVPFLKQLEKDMAGSNVEFVSISLDSSRDAWLKKMEQLDMHGNQLLDIDGSLASSLNVKGIPHFLIYDPQGRLHTYKTTRPSNPQTIETLKGL